MSTLSQLLHLQTTASLAYLPLATLLLLLAPSVFAALAQRCVRAGLRKCSVLNFRDAALERQFVRWSMSGKLALDAVVQGGMAVISASIWFRLSMAGQAEGAAAAGGTAAAGGAVEEAEGAVIGTWQVLPPWLALLGVAGPLVPLALALLLGSERYAVRREGLLVVARLCYTVALLQMHVLGNSQQGGACAPAVALTLLAAACQQLRLSVFIPAQLLHIAVAWAAGCVGGHLLHGLQVVSFGLCLPALLLYSAEVDARKTFLSAMRLHRQSKTAAGRV